MLYNIRSNVILLSVECYITFSKKLYYFLKQGIFLTAERYIPFGQIVYTLRSNSIYPSSNGIYPSTRSKGRSARKSLAVGAPKPSLSGRCFRGTSIAPSKTCARQAHGAFPTQSK